MFGIDDSKMQNMLYDIRMSIMYQVIDGLHNLFVLN